MRAYILLYYCCNVIQILHIRRKNKSTLNPNLPEKRVRKQIVRPDFVTPVKKVKIENMEDEEIHDNNEGTSSTEGENSCTPTKFNENKANNGNGHNNGLPAGNNIFPCPVCRKIFRKKGHMTR
jgi:hypothetical protein